MTTAGPKFSIGVPLTAIALATFYETFKDELKREGKQVRATIRDANKDYVRPMLDKAISFTNSTRQLPPLGLSSTATWLASNAAYYPLRAMRYVNTDRVSPPPGISVRHSYGSRSYGSRSFHRSPFSSRYFKRVYRKSRKPRRKSRKTRKARRRKRSR